MKKLLIIALCVIGLTSCLTEKKLKSHAVRYYAEHPGELAHECADKYPATVMPGDTIRTTDTTTLPGLVIPCPDRVINGVTIHDTVKCPGQKVIHDKVFVHDTLIDRAAVEAMKADTATQGAGFRAQNAKLVQTIIERDKAKEEAKNRLFGLIGCGVVFVGAVVLKIKNIV
jgi:hypothetical protein